MPPSFMIKGINPLGFLHWPLFCSLCHSLHIAVAGSWLETTVMQKEDREARWLQRWVIHLSAIHKPPPLNNHLVMLPIVKAPFAYMQLWKLCLLLPWSQKGKLLLLFIPMSYFHPEQLWLQMRNNSFTSKCSDIYGNT